MTLAKSLISVPEMKTSFELNRILSPVYCWIDSTELDKVASISLPENKKKSFLT